MMHDVRQEETRLRHPLRAQPVCTPYSVKTPNLDGDVNEEIIVSVATSRLLNGLVP